jgi:Holliday junction resolvase RusA-like endonuclease
MSGAVIAFTVPGRIVGKGRPRFAMIAGHARAFTPAKTRNSEAMIRSLAAEASRGAAPISTACHVEVRIYILAPKSWSKRKRAEAKHVTGKPDIDNLLKTACDAMSGIIYVDDALVSAATIQRLYAGEGEQERVEIVVRELLSFPRAA